MAFIDCLTKPLTRAVSRVGAPVRRAIAESGSRPAERKVAMASDTLKLGRTARVGAAGAAVAAKRNPVLLVPGITSAPITLDLIKQDLTDKGYTAFGSMNYFPGLGNIDDYATRLKAEVDRLKLETGATKVDIVAHSMGGLVARRMVQMFGLENQVDHFVMIGTPNHGVIWAKLPVGELLPKDLSVVEMKPGSPFLNKLNGLDGAAGPVDETPGPIKYSTIRGGLDEVVIPHASTPLAGARNFAVPWGMHNEMLVDPVARRRVVSELAR